MASTQHFVKIYELLLAEFGPQDWWPADSPFEVVVGGSVDAEHYWTNVARAIGTLRSGGYLSLPAMLAMPQDKLAEAIRPSGYYNIRPPRPEEFAGDDRGEIRRGTWQPACRCSRERPCQSSGCQRGRSGTADAILLYAGNHPVFVVDAYTHRVFSRHNLVPVECDYHELQAEFMDRLPHDAAMFNEYHALIVLLGKKYCKKKNPLCESCPLQGVFSMRRR